MNLDFVSEQALESKVLDLVHEVRQRHGLPDRSPADLVCKALGLSVEFADLDQYQDGMLRGQQVIINRRVTLASRIEYTVFHEVMHYLLDQNGFHYEYLTDKLSNDEAAFDRAIERFCQLGAAEFMLPRAEVYQMIGSCGFSVNLIPTMMSELGASLVASAIQLAVCAPVRCYALVCRYGPVPRSPHLTTLHVEQASHRFGQKYQVARGTTIPQPHPIWSAWNYGSEKAATSIVPFRSGTSMPCLLTEAVRVGSQVVGLLCLDNPIPKSQLQLF